MLFEIDLVHFMCLTMTIASNYLIENNLAKKVMIVDLDVHQGDELHPFEHQDSVFISFHGQIIIHLKNKIVILIYHLMTTQRI